MTTATETQGFQHPGSPPTKASLTSWWDKFKTRGIGKKEDAKDNPGIFNVPLQQSIKYARVAISLTDANGNSFIYGYIPIVIAKCGVFLKNKATDVEGIFRLSGSAKRIKDLQVIFNSPDKYGKNLSWEGYTVHDAANILRRYLNQLPEPIIPLQFYQRFREPLLHPPINTEAAITQYQILIAELPPLNRQLLLYILDLLAVFASKADVNLMPSPNLAAIFQPGLISHPEHDMSPSDYRVSQDVLVFLIDNQDHFLLGMRGQSDEVEIPSRNPSLPTPLAQRAKTLERNASNASAGAESLRKQGGVRRNVSVSSKRSISGSSPLMTPGSLSRSNTVPSKTRSPLNINPFKSTNSITNTSSAYLKTVPLNKTEKVSTPSLTPSTAKTSENDVFVAQEKGTPTNRRTSDNSIATGTDRSYTRSRPTTPQNPLETPPKDRAFSSLFQSKSVQGEEKRQSNKLKKKSKPTGSSNPSTESLTNTTGSGNIQALSTTSLGQLPVPPLSNPDTLQPPLMPISEPVSSSETNGKAPFPVYHETSEMTTPNLTSSRSIPGDQPNKTIPVETILKEPLAHRVEHEVKPQNVQAYTETQEKQTLPLTNTQHMISDHMMVPVTSNAAYSASTSSLVPATSPALSAASSVSSQTSSHSGQPRVVEQRKHRSIWRISAQKLNLNGNENSQNDRALQSPPAQMHVSGLQSPPPFSSLGVPNSNNSSSNSFSLLGRNRNRSQSVDDRRVVDQRPISPPASPMPQRGVSASGHGGNDNKPVGSGALSWLQKKINDRNEKKEKEVV